MVSEKLERLMKIRGAVAAGHFTADGKLREYTGEISKEMAEMVAKMCAANTLMEDIQTRRF